MQLNYQLIIERGAEISSIMLEDAKRCSPFDRFPKIFTSLEPDVNDPELHFVAKTVLLVHELLPGISLETVADLESLSSEEKEARIVGYKAREILVRFREAYPSISSTLSDIVHEGHDHQDPEIRMLGEERAKLILEAIDIAAYSFVRMRETGKWIY